MAATPVEVAHPQLGHTNTICDTNLGPAYQQRLVEPKIFWQPAQTRMRYIEIVKNPGS